MTTYTAEEFDMISNAVLDASVALNIAHDNLYLMFSDYFASSKAFMTAKIRDSIILGLTATTWRSSSMLLAHSK